jgi:hypothetical protein
LGTIYTESGWPRPFEIRCRPTLWKWDQQRLCALIKTCIARGIHPNHWKVAKGVVLRKPGKPDYTKVKAYRVIALLNCIGKVAEKVVHSTQAIRHCGTERSPGYDEPSEDHSQSCHCLPQHRPRVPPESRLGVTPQCRVEVTPQIRVGVPAAGSFPTPEVGSTTLGFILQNPMWRARSRNCPLCRPSRSGSNPSPDQPPPPGQIPRVGMGAQGVDYDHESPRESRGPARGATGRISLPTPNVSFRADPV